MIRPKRSVSIHPLAAARLFITTLLLCVASSSFAQDSEWVRPQQPGDPLIWGRRDGIVFGVPSPGGIRGPRGLIRVGAYPPSGKEPELLNFFAVEPVVRGPGRRFDRLAFSELEMSDLDPGQRGKRLSVHADPATEGFPDAGILETVNTGNAHIERLSVRIDVEKFSLTGAHVYVILSIEADHPREIQVQCFAEPDSPTLDELTITATMGNFERLRQLWLKDRVIDSRSLFSTYTGDAFVEGESYPLSEMIRSTDADAIVFATNDEFSPRDTEGNATNHWPYTLSKLTQYWRVPGHDVEPDLRVRVNARRVYWASTAPVLGGIAFENFEVRERYVPGQTFVFGITPKDPWTYVHELLDYEHPGTAAPNTHATVKP
jgi:hypothetical protein